MNINHLNEELKEMARLNVMKQALCARTIESPLFAVPHGPIGTDEEEYQYLKQIGLISSDGYPTRAPFPIFRIGGKMGFMMMHFHNSDYGLYDIYQSKRTDKHRLWMFVRVAPDGKAAVMAWRDKQPLLWSTLNTAQSDVLNSEAQMLVKCMNQFIYETMLPNTAILRVAPAPDKNKSVHWHKSRTHYVIITRTQAQRMQREKRGPTDHEIKRAAHWRRAHFRRLSSDRYRVKRGWVVPVKHAWVGPKEWIGSDKKIYQIINPNEPNE